MKHVETYTDMPTILSIKINENIGYINNVYFRINGVNIGRVNWTSRFQTENDSWYRTTYITEEGLERVESIMENSSKLDKKVPFDKIVNNKYSKK